MAAVVSLQEAPRPLGMLAQRPSVLRGCNGATELQTPRVLMLRWCRALVHAIGGRFQCRDGGQGTCKHPDGAI